MLSIDIGKIFSAQNCLYTLAISTLFSYNNIAVTERAAAKKAVSLPNADVAELADAHV